MGVIIDILIRCLLTTFYGTLLAMICLIPRWKLMGKLQNRLSLPNAEQGETPVSTGRPGWSFGTAIGYILFLGALALIAYYFSVPMLWNMMPLLSTRHRFLWSWAGHWC